MPASSRPSPAPLPCRVFTDSDPSASSARLRWLLAAVEEPANAAKATRSVPRSPSPSPLQVFILQPGDASDSGGESSEGERQRRRGRHILGGWLDGLSGDSPGGPNPTLASSPPPTQPLSPSNEDDGKRRGVALLEKAEEHRLRWTLSVNAPAPTGQATAPKEPNDEKVPAT